MPLEPFTDDIDSIYAPQFILSAGDGLFLQRIRMEDFPVIDLSVVMSAGFDMSSCEFTIAGIFDPQKGAFREEVYDTFKPGRVVDVKMGYSSPKGLFKGYINSLSFDFNGQGGPFITVQCLDAKGALVNNKSWKNYGQQPLKAIVKAILTEKCSKYAQIVDVDSDFDKGGGSKKDISPKIKERMDDYQYIIDIAKKTNNSFCVIYDQLHFCENLADKVDANVRLTWGRNLLGFCTEINLSQQVGTVQVFGDDPVTQQTFAAKAMSGQGAGDSGAEIAGVVKNKTMLVRESDVKSQNQADELAKHALEIAEAKLVTCRGSTIGVPEIKAGDHIEIAGMGKGIDGVYFLNRVMHKINGGGYTTSFDGSSPVVRT